MEKHSSKVTASKEEFYKTVEKEFSFLINEYGYTHERKTIPYAIVYSKDNIVIRIASLNYGFGIELEFLVDGESLPLWSVMSRMADRKTATTDRPQLDNVREYAWRVRHECSSLLEGDPVFIGSIRDIIREEEKKRSYDHEQFFIIADLLFNAGQYSACVKHLLESPYVLSQDWVKRLEYAQTECAKG